MKQDLVNTRILMVEDDPKYRQSVLRMFPAFEFLQAGTVKEALDRLHQNPDVKVLILDLQLGPDKGTTLLEAIRDRMEDYRVIVLTAHEAMLAASDAAAYGVFSYVVKTNNSFREALLFHINDAFTALEGAWLTKKVDVHLEIVRKVNALDLSSPSEAERELKEVLELICSRAVELLGAYTCHIRLLDPGRGDFVLWASQGRNSNANSIFAERVPLKKAYSGLAADARERINEPDLQNSQEFKDMKAEALSEPTIDPGYREYLDKVRSACIDPISTSIYGKDIDAIFNINSDELSFFSADEKLELVNDFVSQTNLTITKYRLKKKRRDIHDDYRNIGDMLGEISNVFIAGEDELEEIYKIVFKRISLGLGPELISIFLFDDDAGHLKNVAEYKGDKWVGPMNEHYRPGVGTVGRVYSREKTVLSATSHDELTGKIVESSLPEGYADENITDIPSGVLRHYLAVPITFNNKTIGVIRAVNKKSEDYDLETEKNKSICLLKRGFSEDCQTELEITASHLAATIKNAESIGKQSELVRSLALLNETGQLLTRRLDSREVLQDIVHQIKGVTKADVVILYPFVAATKLFQFPRCSSGIFLNPEFPEPTFSRLDDIASLTLKSSQPIFAANSRALFRLVSGETESQTGRFQEREKIESTAAVPLMVHEEPVGVLFVNFRVPQPFDDPQKQFIEGLAHYAAIAIKNSRVFGDLQSRHVRELELLQAIDSEISKTLELESILGTILRMATEQISADDSSILLYNARNETLEPKAVFGRNFDLRKEQVLSLDDESRITLAAFRKKIPIRVDNVKTDPKWKHLYCAIADDVLSELDVPLMVQETAIGVINMESVKEKAFNQLDVEFLSILANRAVMAILNAQAYEREQRISRELEVMFEISEQIIDQTDPRKICNLILQKALDVTNSAAGNLMLYDPQRNDLWIAAERGVDEDKKEYRQKFGEGIVGQVAATRKLLNAPDVLQESWRQGFIRFIRGTRAELAVPIVESGKVWGVINIESPAVGHFTKADERLLTALANTSVIALQNAERLRSVKKRETQLLSLRDVDQRIVSQLDDPDQVMQAILEGALIQTETGIGYLHLYEDGVIKGTYYAHKNDDGSIVIDKYADEAETLRGFVAHVGANHESYLVAGDAQDHPLYEGDKDIHSQMAATLLSGTEVLGVLTLQSRRLAVFDQEAEGALNILVRQAVIAIQNARNYRRAERELQRFSRLYKAAWELAQITDPADIAKAYDVVLWSADVGQESQALICRYDEASQELEIAHSLRLPPDVRLRRLALDEGVNGQVARTRIPIVVYDTEHLPEDVAMPVTLDLPVNSLVVIPLEFGSRYYGNLALSHQKANYFRGADVELIQGLAKQLAITIYRLETAEAQREAEQRATEAEVMSSLGQSTIELSHRLANDLGLIRSYVNNIRRTLKSSEISNSVVDANLEKIVKDVNIVLELSKGLKQELAGLRNDGVEIREKVLIPVNELLSEIARSVPGLPANLEVRFDVHREVGSVSAVLSQVKDSLRNMFVNAVEALPAGGMITLGARNVGENVSLYVKDNGAGIEPGRQLRIFDLFYSTKGGFGFGLWSARRNALVNGGDLTVESQPGEGTTFSLLLKRGPQERGLNS